MGHVHQGFWVSPRAYPDFAWAWLARFLVSLGFAMSTLYLLFFLQDHLGFASEEAGQQQTTLLLIYTLGMVCTAVLGGWISDRSGKRKVFVVVATVIMAVAGIILALVPANTGGFGLAMIAAIVLGLGYGWYLAVDQALITRCFRPPGTAPAIWASSTSPTPCPRSWPRCCARSS